MFRSWKDTCNYDCYKTGVQVKWIFFVSIVQVPASHRRLRAVPVSPEMDASDSFFDVLLQK